MQIGVPGLDRMASERELADREVDPEHDDVVPLLVGGSEKFAGGAHREVARGCDHACFRGRRGVSVPAFGSMA